MRFERTSDAFEVKLNFFFSIFHLTLLRLTFENLILQKILLLIPSHFFEIFQLTWKRNYLHWIVSFCDAWRRLGNRKKRSRKEKREFRQKIVTQTPEQNCHQKLFMFYDLLSAKNKEKNLLVEKFLCHFSRKIECGDNFPSSRG